MARCEVLMGVGDLERSSRVMLMRGQREKVRGTKRGDQTVVSGLS